MMPRRTWLLAACLVYAGACDDATAPDAALPSSDAQFLAEALDASASAVLDGLFLTGGPAAAPAMTVVSSTTTVTFERTRTCPEDGTITLTGTLTKVWDGEAETYDVEGSGTKSLDDCTLVRGDVLITLNGVSTWTHERHFTHREPSGLWITTARGELEWSKSTGQTGSCTFELTRTVDTAENTVTLTGTFCGHDIDRSRTWRD